MKQNLQILLHKIFHLINLSCSGTAWPSPRQQLQLSGLDPPRVAVAPAATAPQRMRGRLPAGCGKWSFPLIDGFTFKVAPELVGWNLKWCEAAVDYQTSCRFFTQLLIQWFSIIYHILGSSCLHFAIHESGPTILYLISHSENFQAPP